MAGRIPQNFIDDLIARTDIVEVLSTRMELKKAGREYKGLCPFHGEKTPSFTVSQDKGFYHCFGCGAHGTAVGFLMEHDHLSFVEAVESLAGSLGIEVPHEGGDRKQQQGSEQVVELLRRAGEKYTEALKTHEPAIEYLKNRGIDGATAKRFGLGYAPDSWDFVANGFGTDANTIMYLQAAGLTIARDSGGHYDRFRDRVMFPIRDSRGRTVGFGGRVLGDGEPKYMNSPETVVFSKRRELYGLYEARRQLRDIDRLFVVEGYMDVVALARHGIDNAVATLGTATTPEHLSRLFRVTDDVIFCFDGDRAGRKAAWRALETALPEIRDTRQFHFMFLPDGEDPDSLVTNGGSPAFEREAENAMTLADFLVTELSGQVDTDTVDGRARLAELARPLVGKIPAGVFRELLLSQLASVVGLAAEKFSSLMGQAPVESAEPPPRRALQSGGARNLTAVARTIRALLNEPALADQVDLEQLAGLASPGADLLFEILEICQAEPQISPGALLERFRNHAHSRHLQSLLASEELQAVGIDRVAEFEGSVQTLVRTTISDRIDKLIARADQLSPEERAELTDLQRRKDQLGRDSRS